MSEMGYSVVGSITYNNHHVGDLIDKNKILTVRYDFDLDLSEGDRVAFKTEGRKIFAIATIDTVSTMTATEFAKARLDGHQTYRSVGQFLKEMRGYYPDANLNGNTTFMVIRFREIELA